MSESHQSILSLAGKERVVTFGKTKPYTWFFVIFWFVAAAMFVYFVCLFEMIGNLVARYTSCVLILAGGVCGSANTYLSDRMCDYQVRIPAVMWTDRGARILADRKFDPLMSSILLRLAWTLVTFGLIALFLAEPEEGTPAVVSLTIFVMIGICLFGSVVYYWWKRRRRMQYPGDIDLSAEGVHQCLEDRVLEVSWEDIRSLEGLLYKPQGDTYSEWGVICSQQVSRKASQETQPYGSPRLQIFRPLLNAVGDVNNFSIMIASARLYPEWIESLLADPNRVERLRSILTFRDGPKDFRLHLDSLSERRPGLPLSYSDLVMIDLSAPSWLSEWRREEMYVKLRDRKSVV